MKLMIGSRRPSLLAGLIGQDVLHKWYCVPVVYGVYCAAALLALLFIPETRDVNMEDLDGGEVVVAAWVKSKAAGR